MKIHHLRTGFLCIVLALLGAKTVHAADGPELPPPVYPGPGPLIDGGNPTVTNSVRAFRGSWTLQSPNKGAITAGTIIVIVTTDGRVFGIVRIGEESQNFNGFVNRSGTFRALLIGGGHLQGQISDDNALGKIFHGRHPTSWIATPILIESSEFSLNAPPPPVGPPPPYEEGRPYEGLGPLIRAP
jgi:hypothetical protein